MLHYNLNVLLQEVMMRKVDLRMNEDKKYRIIKKLVESNGNKEKGCHETELLYQNYQQIDFQIQRNGKGRLCSRQSQ